MPCQNVLLEFAISSELVTAVLASEKFGELRCVLTTLEIIALMIFLSIHILIKLL
jgi:hypothetical protein